MVKYVIPLPPVTKKNSLRIIRVGQYNRIAQSAQYVKFERDAMLYLKPKPEQPIDSPVNVCCTYYMPTRRRVDLSNLISATLDVLVAGNVLADDNRDIAAATDGSRVYYDKTNPRTEVVITPLENYARWKE